MGSGSDVFAVAVRLLLHHWTDLLHHHIRDLQLATSRKVSVLVPQHLQHHADYCQRHRALPHKSHRSQFEGEDGLVLVRHSLLGVHLDILPSA